MNNESRYFVQSCTMYGEFSNIINNNSAVFFVRYSGPFLKWICHDDAEGPTSVYQEKVDKDS